MKTFITAAMTIAAMAAASNTVWGQGHDGPSNCSGLPSASELKTFLIAAPGTVAMPAASFTGRGCGERW